MSEIKAYYHKNVGVFMGIYDIRNQYTDCCLRHEKSYISKIKFEKHSIQFMGLETNKYQLHAGDSDDFYHSHLIAQ